VNEVFIIECYNGHIRREYVFGLFDFGEKSY